MPTQQSERIYATNVPPPGKICVARALGQVISGYRDGDFKRSVEALMVVIDLLEQQEIKLQNAQKEIEELNRGEFICRKCGLRKDAEFEKGDF